MKTTNSPTLERIRARKPVALDSQTFAAAVAYFRANPGESFVYVRWDGKCIPDAEMHGKCRTRTGQLVSIATDGIPMCVSRKRADIAAELARPVFQSHIAESAFAIAADQMRKAGATLGGAE